MDPMKIPLGETGQHTLVSSEDYPELSKYKWHIRSGYVARAVWSGKQRRYIQMHNAVLPNSDPKLVIDHADGNKLNNTRQNLRLSTHTENARNRALQSTYKGEVLLSQYKGVSKKNELWVAVIRVEKQLKHLGQFSDEVEAARCYDAAAVEFFQEYARLNFPDDPPVETWQEITARSTQALRSEKWTSKYSGVCWNEERRKWVANYGASGGPGYLGIFASEDAAARCVDAAAFEYEGEEAKLNFPDQLPSKGWKDLLEKKVSSSYRGVSYAKRFNKWKAAITVEGKQHWGGNWNTELEAAKAYDNLARQHLGEKAKLNFPDE